jgi:hypothetical protein
VQQGNVIRLHTGRDTIARRTWDALKTAASCPEQSVDPVNTPGQRHPAEDLSGRVATETSKCRQGPPRISDDIRYFFFSFLPGAADTCKAGRRPGRCAGVRGDVDDEGVL